MRGLLPAEKALIETMLKNNAAHSDFIKDLPQCLVEEMDDGGMGSVRFVSDHPDRTFGLLLANFEFTDSDGVVVLVALNLDNNGELYELDVWKTDFSPLNRFPD